MSKILVLNPGQFRRDKLIRDVQQWAGSRNIAFSEFSPQSADQEDFSGAGAVYLPLYHHLDILDSIPADIPVILDYDGAVEINGVDRLATRRLALRRAFGGPPPKSLRPEFQVPYIHKTLSPEKESSRNIVIIDLHHWLPPACQFSFLAHLSELNAHYDFLSAQLGSPIQFYFTAFVSPEPYHELSSNLESILFRHTRKKINEVTGLDNVINNLIPPFEDISDYHALFQKSLLFITDNGDLADQDIVHAISAECPIWVISRSPFKNFSRISYTLENALKRLVPDFLPFLETANRNLAGPDQPFRNILKAQGVKNDSISLLESAFFNTWDALWTWAIDKEWDPAISKLIDESPAPFWWFRNSW
jgi:hypothetical protein